MTTQPSDWAVARAFWEAQGKLHRMSVARAFSEEVMDRARELDASGGVIPMDKGPWRASDDGKHLHSEDFAVDAMLTIGGDFIDDHHRKDYAAWLARTLNNATPRAAEAGDKDGERYRWLRGNLLWAKSYDGYVRWTVEILMPEPGIHEGHPPVAETLDAAIDAAKAGERG